MKSLGAVIEQDKDVLTITGIKSPKNHIKRERKDKEMSRVHFLVLFLIFFKLKIP